MRSKTILGLLFFLSAWACPAQEPSRTLRIRNEVLTLEWNAGAFTVSENKTGKPFLRNGKLEGQVTEAAFRPADDPTLGKGESIEVTTASGNTHLLMLFPKVPFVLLRSFLYNAGGEIYVVRNYRPGSFALDLGKAPDALRTFGTAGLTAPDKNPGSYVYLAVVDPESRKGVVGGWITHDRGSGAIFSRVETGAVYLDAQIDYGHLPVLPGRPAQTETLALGCFDDARLGLEAWADTIARVYRIKLRPQTSGYCTWYSKPNGGASDAQHLVELAEFAGRELKPFGLSFIQIDDKWQTGKRRNGPAKNFSAADPQGPYPHGMKAAADKLEALGFTAGIWFMPFAGDHLDPYFKDHPEWFVKRTDGGFYETSWGGSSLDMTETGARAQLQKVVRAIRGWNFRYFKMDGLWTGTATAQVYVNDGYRDDKIGDAVFHDPDKTNIEAMRDGLKLVREAAGPDVFFSGCNLSQNMRSFSGSVGLVDSMRIGPDNGPDWPKNAGGRGLLSGPNYGSRRYFMHGRIWWNDPDPVYVRATMPLEHARLIASWVALSGQFFLSSDWLPDLPAERLDILKRTMLNHGLLPRPVDLFENPIPRVWLLTDTHSGVRRDIVGLYNWDNENRTIEYTMDRIGLDGGAKYQVFDFWANRLLPPIMGTLRTALPPQSCKILALRASGSHPQLLSTSRHVTQGIADVIEEKWDKEKKTLEGRSRLVAGDPYELRVYLPASKNAWTLKAATAAGEGRAAGFLTVSVTAEESLLRITIKSPESSDVRWKLDF